jgi:parallel beta-helix repeat protein
MKKRIGCKILAVSIGLMIIASGVAVDTTPGNNALKSNTIIYVPDDYGKIQGAVDSASAGDTIIVRDGTYYENVKVNKRLTIRSENGSAHTIVVAGKANDHVFEVTADSVSIKGLTVKDATGKNKMGMYISANHCNITDNTALNNPYGFFLSDSTKNTLINNIASDNLGDGIYLYYSSSNILSNNIIAKSNSRNGIRLWHSHSNTLHNNIASKNMVGILLGYSHNNILEKNEARSNNNDGIQLEYSNNNTLTNNIAKLNNEDGISLISSNNNIMANNTASVNNEIGISLYTSGNCTLTNNMMDGNYYNFGVSSNSIYHLIQSIDTSNLVDGKPVYYWVGQQNRAIPMDAGFIGIVNSVNITARDLTLTKNSVGILLAYSMLSRIENVSTSNNLYGIALAASTNNILINNRNSNNGRGINMVSSHYNLLAMNRNLNNYEGIVLSSSSYNFLTMNNILNSYRNGISLENSLNNIIYLNNFINNPINVHSSNSITIWNFISEISYIYNETAYTSYMGNYWSDYSIDMRGVYIDRDTNGDGIGDRPHYICFDKDFYPLTKPFESYIYKSCR